MPQRVKQAVERATRPDKSTGNGKHINSRQAMDSHGSGARTRLRHHPLIPSQYRRGRPWVRGKRGYGLAVGRRGEVYSGVHAQALLGEMSCWDDIPPKKGKMS